MLHDHASEPVMTGLDVLKADDFQLLRGLRIGVAANQTAVTSDLMHITDLFHVNGIDIRAFFAPEHGIRGEMQDGVGITSCIDKQTGIPVYSLYGDVKAPTADMMQNLDAVVFDIQDIGCRYYTFIWTMAFIMQSCAEHGRKMIVLDRPNPITGSHVEGGSIASGFTSFVGMYPVPVRHGLTVGEMALYLNTEHSIGAELTVVPCNGLTRQMWFDETGLPWVAPSPNMPTPQTALLYPGTCLIEGTNVSEGRGTTKPFELIGAPWIDPYELAEYLNSMSLPGTDFRPVWFKPEFSKYKGLSCGGVQVHVLNRDEFMPVQTGLHLVYALHHLYPADFRFREVDASGRSFFDLLAGTDEIRLAISSGEPLHVFGELDVVDRSYQSKAKLYHLYE
ncbi:MAG: exo-beta-N-acetylmuramidase NamZ family protein [Armatimonadota bacterium]